MASDALSLEVRCGYEILPAGVVTRLPVLLRVRAQKPGPAGEPAARPPLCTVLCLDTSGSMQGEPLREVQHAVSRLGQLLSDDDILGVVAFHSEARPLGPLRRLGDPGARAALRKEVSALVAEGKTNIDGGLAKAALLLPAVAPGSLAHQAILLLSDGQPNVGARRPEDLAAATALIHQRGVNLCTLGFGKEHNEDILLAIAQAGGGRYAYVKDPQAADTAFARALGALLDLAAREVTLVLRPAPGVVIKRVLGDPVTAFTDSGLQITLPDLLDGESLDVVAELEVTGRRDQGPCRLLRATLSAACEARAPAQPAPRTAVVVEVEVQLADAAANPNLAVGPGHPDVERAEAQALIAGLRDQARACADRRDYAGAALLLRQALARVERVPGFAREELTPLSDAYEALRDDILIVEAKAPDRDEKYREYRKIQLDGQSIGGSLKGGGPTTMSPSVRRMTNQVAIDGGVEGRLVVLQGSASNPPPRAEGAPVAGASLARGEAPQSSMEEPAKPAELATASAMRAAHQRALPFPAHLQQQVFPVAGEMRLGRGKANDVVLNEDQASRLHAVILPGGREGGYLLEDMGSSNGTQVNGSHIYKGVRLKDGDLIQIGKTVLRFEVIQPRRPPPLALVKPGNKP